MKLLPVLTVAALSVTTLTAAGMPGQAPFVTRCVGVGGAVTVPGDLVVPAGASCTLEGTTVTGAVRVQAGADLVLVDATVGGNVVLQRDAYLDAVDSTLEGNVANRGGFGTAVENTSLGAYTGTAAEEETQSPFLLGEGAAFGGRVSATGGYVLLESSTVDGWLSGDGIEFTDLVDTVVEGDLTVRDNEFGSLVCAGEVHGDALFSTNQLGVQLGGSGPLGDCEGQVGYWGGDVQVDGTTGGVAVDDTIVREDLAGEGNDPAPVGDGNRVRGALLGDFADLQPAAPALSQRAVPSEARERRAAVDTVREDRLADAVRQSERAGDADL